MIRLLAVLAVALLAVACGGDDEAARPTMLPATATPAAVESTPTPVAPALGIVPLPAPPPVRTLTLVPASGVLQQPGQMAPDATQVLFYAAQPGRLVGLETPLLRGFPSWGWTPSGLALVGTTSGLVLYDPGSNTAQRLDLADEVSQVVVATTTTRAALQLASGQLAVLDLTTWQYQPLSLNARPLRWSPDGRRLLVQVQGAGPAVVLLDTPAARLYTLPTAPVGGRYVGWVSDTALLQLVPQSAQTVDVSGPAPRVTAHPFEGFQVGVHRGAVRLAASDFSRSGVSIYDALSLQKQRDVPGASLGSSLEVSDTIWSADASKVLLIADECLETERIILYDIAAGTSHDVAKGVPFEMALSPDTRQVAYTAMGKNLFIVPADGSAAPRLIYGEVAAPMPIAWSPDGSALGFVHFYGGYDRCVGNR